MALGATRGEDRRHLVEGDALHRPRSGERKRREHARGRAAHHRGTTVSTADALLLLALALIVTTTLLRTLEVCTLKVALLDPAATWMLDGTAATPGLLLLKVSSTPAVPETVTVALASRPPVTVALLKVSAMAVGGGGTLGHELVAPGEPDTRPVGKPELVAQLLEALED